MTYPLVRDLAAEGTPVAATCGGLGFSPPGLLPVARQPGERPRLARAPTSSTPSSTSTPTTPSSATGSSPELQRLGWDVGENRVQRLCQEHRIWSTATRKGRKAKKAGPPVHDDLVEREFAVDELDRLWLTDITEHAIGEGKLYICAVKDACSNRIVGYAPGPRMTARLAVAALQLATSDAAPWARSSYIATAVPRPGRGRTCRR